MAGVQAVIGPTWILTHTDRFKAISSGAGTMNWISMYAQSDVQRNRLVKSVSELAWMDYYVRGKGEKLSWRQVLESLESEKKEKKEEEKETEEGIKGN